MGCRTSCGRCGGSSTPPASPAPPPAPGATRPRRRWDPDVVEDTLHPLRELVPQRAQWRHAEGNSDAHLKTMLIGPGVTLPVSGGRVRLGRWQKVFLCEFDGPRRRELWLTLNAGAD